MAVRLPSGVPRTLLNRGVSMDLLRESGIILNAGRSSVKVKAW
jgi:hypothetical protein